MDEISSKFDELKESLGLNSGSFLLKFYDEKMPKFTIELSAILTVTNCHETKMIEEKAHAKQIIFMGVTSVNCQRIKNDNSISIPIGKWIETISRNFQALHKSNSNITLNEFWSYLLSYEYFLKLSFS